LIQEVDISSVRIRISPLALWIMKFRIAKLGKDMYNEKDSLIINFLENIRKEER